jgi:hypothetical protein
MACWFKARFVTNWYQRKERHSEVTLPRFLVVGDVTNWYQSKERCSKVTFLNLLVVGDVTLSNNITPN